MASKRTILIFSERELSDLPIAQALSELGYEIGCLGPSEIAKAPSTRADAIVIPHLELTEAAIDQIQNAYNAPILLADSTLSEEFSQDSHGYLGVTRIPDNLTGVHLEWAIACACEFFTLHSQISHYQALLESSPVGVFQITDGQVSHVNDYLLKQLRYKRTDLLGVDPISIFVPEDRPKAIQAMQMLPHRPDDAPPNTYRILTADQRVLIGEIRTRLISQAGGVKIEGTLRDITQETRIEQLHRVVLELTEVILEEEDIDHILQLVLDTIVEHSGFRRALLSLYDLSIPDPFEGPVYKILTSGLTDEERGSIFSQPPMGIEERKRVFAEEYVLGPAQYIPHNRTPWSGEFGISGTVTIEGWHPDDYLFIPLRGAGGIIGIISVDDPVDQGAPTLASIEEVAFLARFAAIAVERVFKLGRLKKQAEQLHGLSLLGHELAITTDELSLCEAVTDRVCQDMDYDLCEIWLRDGQHLIDRKSVV